MAEAIVREFLQQAAENDFLEHGVYQHRQHVLRRRCQRPGPLCIRLQHQEQHHPYPVVEQRLSRNLDLEALGGTDPGHDAEDGDRIGGRDQGTEEEADHERCVQLHPAKNQVGQTSHQNGREHDAHGRQGGDRPLLFAQVVEVDVQGSRKEQEAEHAVEQRLLQVDGFKDLVGALVGAATALLLAPVSGEELQGQIRAQVEQIQLEVKTAASERRTELEEQLSSLREPRPPA
mgnify:CR=1 FL=1